MATITPANLAYKDKDGDLGEVKSLTDTDVTLLNTALQDIEDLKLAYMPGYVKRDFSNVTQDGKNASVSWVMPNYNAGISKTWGVDNIAESAGVVIAHDSSQQSTPILVTVNNQTLFPRGVIASSAYLEVSFWVAKNDTWKVTGGDNSTRSLIFFPCKGAN